MSLEVIIDGVDRISFLIHESLSISQTNDGLNSTCEFDLVDQAIIKDDVWTVEVTAVEDGDYITDYTTFFPQTKVEVSIVDGATTYFAGVLSSIAVDHQGQIEVDGLSVPTDRILRCSCHDFNSILEESVVDNLEEYGAATVEEIIDDIFAKYVTGIDFATHVTAPFAIAEISFESVTVRQVMDTLCAQADYVWYVDYDKKLHCALVEANSPAWHFSDNPDEVNSFAYLEDITKDVDAVNLVNMIFVVGGIAALWFTDTDSRNTYGDHQAIVRDTTLIDIEDIEDRGEALLEQYKDPTVSYKLRTYKDGLRAGMHVRLVCAFLDVDATYLINNLSVSFPVDGDPVYEVTMGGLESSISVSAHRLTLDQIHQANSPIVSSQLALASQDWGHDLTFSATDEDTVEWNAGTLTSAGGLAYSIAAGNTGNIVAKTIVYLNTDISTTVLQTTTDEVVAMGNNSVMVAVCWPGIVAAGDQPEVPAGFQVFGSSSEGPQTFLNADNLAANCITANEIYVNSLSAIVANMGSLTTGEIRMIGAAGAMILTSAGAGGILLFDGDDPDVDDISIHLKLDDGKLYAGAGDVWMDKDGLGLLYGDHGDRNKIQWFDGGVSRAEIYSTEQFSQHRLYITAGPAEDSDHFGWIELKAEGGTGHSRTDVIIRGEDDNLVGRIRNYIYDADGSYAIQVGAKTTFYAYDTRVNIGTDTLFRVGTGTAEPVADVEDGQLFYRTDTDKLRLRANGIWVNLN